MCANFMIPNDASHAPMMSRRQVLKCTGMGLGTFALANLLGNQGLLNRSVGAELAGRARSPSSTPHFRPRARAVIWIVLNGGPSQVDTWDYKPELQQRDGESLEGADPNTGFFVTSGKLLKSPFQFRQHGESRTWASEIFPYLVKQVDDIAFVHSCYTESNNHAPALFQINTGMNRMGFPCVGSWVTYGLGSENVNLPGFVVMTDAKGRGLPKGHAQNWGSAFLPGVYQGTRLNNEGPPIDNLHRLRELSHQQQRRQLDALREINRQHQRSYAYETELAARIESFELAFRMQMTAPEVMDISGESQYTKVRYGLEKNSCSHFAHQCLLARRLVEQGVRFIQIYSGGTDNEKSWDAHNNLTGNHSQFAAETDQPIAALLADLKARGLFDSTLVVCGGEFGRTSDSQNADGRDHNPHAFTTWLAGGGVKGGVHYGSTDEFGYKAVQNRVSVHDLHATVMHLVGLDHERLTYRFNGRDQRLTDVSGNVLTDILA